MTVAHAENPTAFRFTDDVEVHTSDLTAACMRQVQLKHQGLARGSYTTALYRGQLAHAMLEYVHLHNAWSVEGRDFALSWAREHVEQTAEQEGRPLSASVSANRDKIDAEVAVVVQHYIDRLGDYFSRCKMIGVELPIRWVMDMPEGMAPVVFASHLDLLFRDEHDQLKCWDWKWQKDAPTMDFLGRNLQFSLYFLMLAYGEVRTDADLDVWTEFGEFADFGWADLARFKPYAKRTETSNYSTGEVEVFKKGDERPMRNIVRRWTFSPDREQDIRRELATRVVMARHGLFPATPSKEGCLVCECKHACPAFNHDPKEVIPQ